MKNKLIYYILIMFSASVFSREIIKDVEIFWSSDRNEKLLLDWEVKTFFMWDEQQGTYSPSYRHDIVIPPLLSFELQNEARQNRKQDSLVNGNVLRINSMLGDKIVALKKIANDGEKKEAKLNIILGNKLENKIIYHEQCHEGVFKGLNLIFEETIEGTIYVSCSKKVRAWQFDLYSKFADVRLLSASGEILTKRKTDEHLRLSVIH